VPDTSYPAGEGRQLRAYLAQPRGQGPWPGVVVIMDALGLSDDIRLQADRLAAAGYLAFAPDLYSGRGIRCVVATLAASRSGSGEAFTHIEAARRWLDDRDDCTGRIGIIGFCMGGGFALVLAAQQGDKIGAAVPFYAVLGEDYPSFEGLSAPLLGHFGEQDQMQSPDQVRELADTIEKQTGQRPDFRFYPAGHAFFNDENLLGTYDPEQAAKAWDATVRFLREQLEAPQTV
jgi:carboxymethylenebutenolidase